MVECVGIAIALVVVVSLTRYSTVGFSAAERFWAAVINFIVAIPMLVVFAGPFYLRRVRRGLREYIRKRANGAEPS